MRETVFERGIGDPLHMITVSFVFNQKFQLHLKTCLGQI